MLLLQRYNRMFEKSGGLVHVKLRFAASRDSQVLQDLGLQRSAEAFGSFDAVVFGGGLQFRERVDAEMLVETQHFLGAETRQGKRLKHPLGNLLPRLG